MDQGKILSIEEVMRLVKENPNKVTESLRFKQASLKAEIDNNLKIIDSLEKQISEMSSENQQLKELFESYKNLETEEEFEKALSSLKEFEEKNLKDIEELFSKNDFLRYL